MSSDCALSKLLIKIETLLELVDTSAGVNQLLLACEEWVALGANFDFDILLCGTCFNNVTASTCDCCWFICWVDTFSHYSHLFHNYYDTHSSPS